MTLTCIFVKKKLLQSYSVEMYTHLRYLINCKKPSLV